jgi:hypothetical protein
MTEPRTSARPPITPPTIAGVLLLLSPFPLLVVPSSLLAVLDCVGEVERSAPDVAEAVPDSVAGNPVVAVVRNRPEVNLGVDWVEESED